MTVIVVTSDESMFVRLQATDSMKMSMTHATIERNAAMQEMKKLHKKAHSMEKELEQVCQPKDLLGGEGTRACMSAQRSTWWRRNKSRYVSPEVYLVEKELEQVCQPRGLLGGEGTRAGMSAQRSTWWRRN